MAKDVPLNRDALPAHGVRNDHPAIKANVIPAKQRTSKEVAAECKAIRKAAEEKAERGEAAKRLLAEMQVGKEMFDKDMEIDNPHHLATVGGCSQAESGDDRGESFESISSGSDSEDEPIKVIVSDP